MTLLLHVIYDPAVIMYGGHISVSMWQFGEYIDFVNRIQLVCDAVLPPQKVFWYE